MVLEKIQKISRKTFSVIWIVTMVIFACIIISNLSFNILDSEPLNKNIIYYCYAFFLVGDVMVGVSSFCILLFKDIHAKRPCFRSVFHDVCLTIWLICIQAFTWIAFYYVYIIDGTNSSTAPGPLPYIVGLGFISYIFSLIPLKQEDETNESSGQGPVAYSDRLEDILFVPKKRGNSLGWVLVVLFIVIVGVLGLIFYNPTAKTDIPDVPSVRSFPIGLLTFDNISSQWVGQLFYIKATIKNGSGQNALNIQIRVDFYKDKENTKLFDTRYITLPVVAAGGAYTFSEPVQLNNVKDEFWYQLKVDSAQ